MGTVYSTSCDKCHRAIKQSAWLDSHFNLALTGGVAAVDLCSTCAQAELRRVLCILNSEQQLRWAEGMKSRGVGVQSLFYTVGTKGALT